MDDQHADLGKHGTPPLPWFRRPRQPFELTGFSLRLVVPLLTLGPLLGAGVLAVVNAEDATGGLIQIIVGLVLLAFTGAYFARPIKK